MGEYMWRQINTDIWSNKMTAEDRYLYLFLRTNPLSTNIGFYPISKKQIAFYSGYPLEKVNIILERLEHKFYLIEYDPKKYKIIVL